jgi:hypothetical protein
MQQQAHIDQRMEDECLSYVVFKMSPPASHTPNLVDDVKFLHASWGDLVPTTWIQAINSGHFTLMWPGLIANFVHKHLPKSMATAQGHMHQE